MATYPCVWRRGFKKLADCEILGHAATHKEAQDVFAILPEEIGGSRRYSCELLDRDGEIAWEPKFAKLQDAGV